MRHWSLYESIIHSRHVAVRLGTWQDKGRDKLDELLVKMGLSQRDCRQDYCKRPTVAEAFAFVCSLLSAPHNFCLYWVNLGMMQALTLL